MALYFAKRTFAFALCLCLEAVCKAQDAPAEQKQLDQTASASAAVLSNPPLTGPLLAVAPITFGAGPVGKIAVNGILSGVGLWQGNPVVGNSPTHTNLSNGQVFVQKSDGWFQFYLQAGGYTIPDLATPFMSAGKTMSNFFGPVPVAYLKLAPSENTSIQIGLLPTLIGAEYTFSFQNMNIERGLLWNQENAVNRGIQVNQKLGKFAASVSWNDGFYSNRYTWLTGALSYTTGPHSLAFTAGGNLGSTAFQNLATPVQNNGSIYDIIYTYTKGPWVVQPYFQYTAVPINVRANIEKGASTAGGALLVSRTFRSGFSLAGRYEYIASTGDVAQQPVNLLFGPGSAGTSVTLTPTLQRGGFFVRGDLSYVHAFDISPGTVFGPEGVHKTQHRLMAEVGFMFGHNLFERFR